MDITQVSAGIYSLPDSNIHPMGCGKPKVTSKVLDICGRGGGVGGQGRASLALNACFSVMCSFMVFPVHADPIPLNAVLAPQL